MKKTIIMMLICLLILSFSSCDNGQEAQEQLEQLKTEYARFDPYIELIEALENNDFTTVDRIIDGYRATYNNTLIHDRVIDEIEINASNWNEYFEVREITQWRKNDLDETTGFITHVCIVLKDEYANRVVSDHTQINFGWEALCSVKNCDVDLENQIVTFENVFKSNSTTFGDPETLSGTISFDGKLVCEDAFGSASVAAKIGEIVIVGEYSLDGQMKPVCFDYDNTTITCAEGILTLYRLGE